MRKKIIIIISSIVIILGVIVILMFYGVIPNIFLNRSDLSCYRSGEQYDTYKLDKYIVFSFNNAGRIKNGETQDHLIYYDTQVASTEFIEFQQLFEDYSNETLRLENNKIIIVGDFEISLDEENMTRRKIYKKYKELGYECE